jgi:hypothetical protein
LFCFVSLGVFRDKLRCDGLNQTPEQTHAFCGSDDCFLFPQPPSGLLLKGSVHRVHRFHKGNIKTWVWWLPFLLLKFRLLMLGF